MDKIKKEQEHRIRFEILSIRKSCNRVQTMFKELGYEISLEHD